MSINNAETLSYFFGEYPKRLRVPEFQRNYTWSDDHWGELWSDLTKSDSSEPHYLGALILLCDNDTPDDEFQIVDGQQRLVTLTILSFAIRNFINIYMEKEENSFVKHIARDDKTKNNARSGLQRLNPLIVILGRDVTDGTRLLLNPNDDKHFQALAVDELKIEQETGRNTSRILKCFAFYLDKIKKEILNEEDPIDRISSLVTYLNNLLFTIVEVTDDAEAFDVFESLNAKGSLLTAADLLKNRFIMYYRDDTDKQKEVSNNWDILLKILEDEDSRFDIVEFIWFYWNGFHQSGTTKKALYRKIREHIREVAPLLFLKDLQDSAVDFASWTASTREFPLRGSSDADTALGEINLLRYRSCYPAFLLIKKKRPDLFDKFVIHSINFLFRRGFNW